MENKTAEQMFNEIGYHLVKEHSSWFAILIYERRGRERIYFDEDNHFSKEGWGNQFINMEELKCINKQCEELGWLK